MKRTVSQMSYAPEGATGLKKKEINKERIKDH
jgi:hypothetical protein